LKRNRESKGRCSGMKMPFPYLSIAVGTVLLIVGSFTLLSTAILALLSPSYFRTQTDLVLANAWIYVLVAGSGISLILLGRASKRLACISIHVGNLIIHKQSYALRLMNEHSLHSEIKEWYTISGDKTEVRIDDFIIDIARGTLLIEIQTRNFSAIKRKLSSLVKNHKVRLVHPIPERKWIVRVAETGDVLSRRKSPKKGRLVDLFYELVNISDLVDNDNFSLEVLMIEEEEIRCNDGKGSWRRKGVSIKDAKMVNVNSKQLFKSRKDFLTFLPNDLRTSFTNRTLANQAGVSIPLARKITYCLRKIGVITCVGRKRRELIFQKTLR